MTQTTRVPWWQGPWLALFFVVFTLSIVIFLWLFLIPRHRREPWAARLGMPCWTWLMQAMLFRATSRIIGAEHLPQTRRGFLMIANHESVADIWLLAHYLRPGFLMKASLLLSPIGWGAYLSGGVPVHRGAKESRERAIERTLTMATRSTPMLAFLEGTFGHEDGTLRAPHLNLLRHAYDRGLPVLPVGHAGCRRAMNGDTLPLAFKAALVLVLRPVVQPAAHPDREAFAAACWQEVVRAVAVARAEVPRGWPYDGERAAAGRL
ncbi:MAG: 1-acyl-sn-glycerol-3-phosphate acyltransferase [Deltaproteobacteria bacterium]|nr:1-acyl-sn-glycerol-3-phosphate acyltransferase [Deltaproteobacteria bacterium]